MIGRLSDISYTLWGDADYQTATDDVFDLSSAYLDVLDGTIVVFDGPDSNNALASPQNLLFNHGDGTVLIGRRLIQAHQSSFGSHWLPALATTVAHETGHLAQYKSRLNVPKRTAELHADFLAGWTLQRFGLRPDRRRYSDASIARQSLRLLQRANSAVHGTVAERVQAFERGWQFANAHMTPSELKNVPVVEGLQLLARE